MVRGDGSNSAVPWPPGGEMSCPISTLPLVTGFRWSSLPLKPPPLLKPLGRRRGFWFMPKRRGLRASFEWPSSTRPGVQLDLMLMPAERRPGLPQSSVALVDKDGLLADVWTPPVAEATADQAREWTMLGWWALSNVAKYVRRASLFEAVAALADARAHALRLFAVARGIPYPAFGLTSLLDFEPFELPDELRATYALPSQPDAVIDAAWAVSDLLGAGAADVGRKFGVDLATAWAGIARARLRAAGNQS